MFLKTTSLDINLQLLIILKQEATCSSIYAFCWCLLIPLLLRVALALFSGGLLARARAKDTSSKPGSPQPKAPRPGVRQISRSGHVSIDLFRLVAKSAHGTERPMRSPRVRASHLLHQDGAGFFGLVLSVASGRPTRALYTGNRICLV